MDANVDYYYNEYANEMENDNLIDIHANGLVYRYDISSANNECYEILEEKMYEYVYKSDSFNYVSKFEFKEIEDYSEKLKYGIFQKFFEQRPDMKLLYNDTNKKIIELADEYNYMRDKLTLLECVVDYSSNEIVQENFDELLSLKEELENVLEEYIKKMDYIIEEVNEYQNNLASLIRIKDDIEQFKIENTSFDPNCIFDDSEETSYEKEKYILLLEKKQLYEEKIRVQISSSITLKDVSDELKGYNSSYGKVPAGQWDTFINPNYEGEGHITGLIGSFEGPQGKETGYDSRKGEEKANYKDPDRSLLKLLSEVTDKDGNILYPLSSFEKGGEYYYHIFGVNDDGSINWDLIDNPRFGCKMLGDYLIVGGDQRFNRERGSKIMTSIGPAITIDCGTIDDLDIDPNHIDISIDEVLFWLKDFSHNEERPVQSLAGIYDWCTDSNYCGTVDANYEHMERNYVNNLNELYGTTFICIFDRDDFEDETSYESQEEFVYKLKI